MINPLLETKLYIPPPRSAWVPRQRLIKQLNDGTDLKLTLISAPAGFGKTTFLSAWVAQSKRPVAWVSLDKNDNDLHRFLGYLLTALQRINRDIGKSAQSMLHSPQISPSDILLSGLINEIANTPEPFTLVLDDYHEIIDKQVHELITLILDDQPSQMHLVISSRADPPWPLARLRGSGELSEIRADDLRFTTRETATFLDNVLGFSLVSEDIDTLENRTEGWIAGLKMAALSMKGRKDVSGFIKSFSGSHRFVLDYLVEEVLDQQSSDIQEFLLFTSILKRMTAPLCNSVIGRDDSHLILAQLEQANLFLVHLDDERTWYRYHQLFADLLRSRVKHAQPDLIPALHRRASEWYEKAELVEEAVVHANAGGDYKRAAHLIEQNAMQMIIRGKHPVVYRWLEELPDELVRARPWLCVYHAWMRYWSGMREEVEECLQNAEQALASTLSLSEFKKRSAKNPFLTEIEKPDIQSPRPVGEGSEAERKHIAGYIAAIRAHNALNSEKIPRALEMAEQAVELLPERDYMRSLVGIVLGAAYGSQGDIMAARLAYAEASEIAQKYSHQIISVSAATYLGMEQAKQALLQEAFGTYREALELAVGPDEKQLPIAGFPLVKLGDLSREWNDLEAASRDLEKGVEVCAQWGQTDFLADGYVALSRLQLAGGNLGDALNTLQRVERLVHRVEVDKFIICWLDECRLRLWLSEGNLAAAVHWAQMSGLRVDGDLSYHHDLDHINLARVLIAQGRQHPSGTFLEEALELLARLLAAAEKAGWIHQEIKILILQALAHQSAGDKEEALTALAQALSRAEPGGYVRTFIDEGIPMGKILRQAVARGIAVGYAGKLLAALEEETEGKSRKIKSTSSSYLVEPLSKRELEVLRLLTTHLSSPEIASELVISKNTVRSHIKRIYSKLNVHNRRDAITRAEELELL